MHYLLHLSDLHLSAVDERDVTGDYKRRVIPLADRQRRRRTLEATLRSLGEWLRDRDSDLDAIVVTGDVTYQNQLDGFELLGETLGCLGDRLPGSSRILVVPGNHDVRWETDPGTPERYERYLAHVRRKGYVTPLLEGIDLGEGGERLAGTADPVLIATDASFVVVALNSSNYCGVVEGLEILDEKDLERVKGMAQRDPVLGRLQEEVRRLRLVDIPRISVQQLKAAGDVLNDLRRHLPSSHYARPVRIAALHHQLLPVSTMEEVKPYESLTNLGEVREFLRSSEIDIVLHGHKHVNRAYWDHHYGNEDEESLLDASSGRPVLVISCGTIGSSVGDEMGRLIEVPGHRADRPRARVVRIYALRSVSAGTRTVDHWRTSEVRLPQRPVPLPMRSATLLQGETTSDVYSQVLERFDEIPTGERLEKLSCHVIDGASALHLPQGYPSIHGYEDLDRWLEETVSWWQRHTSNLRSLRFTHGERIHRYAQTIDQLSSVITALKDDPTTGRALISFFDPRFDLITDRSIKFPSFCTLQFVIDDARALDCIAYFRVQEMKYWWPVNMAEIATIQRTIIDRLWAERINLRPGSILTHAAIALWEETPPRVLVPLIDRIAEDDRHRLRSMAYALFQPGMRGRSERLADWERVLDDWLPPERLDRSGAPVPIDGLIALKNEVEWFANEYPDRDGGPVIRVLEQMIVDNQAYLASQGTGVDRFEAHSQWRLRTLDNVARLRAAIAALGHA